MDRNRSSSSPAADHIILTLAVVVIVLSIVGFLAGMALMLDAIVRGVRG